MLLTAPRPHHGINSATVPGICSRCAHPVALSVEAESEVTVVCDVCVEQLRPKSTWPGHSATSTWWLEEVIEHGASGSTDVVRAHGLELVRYRRDGRDLVLVVIGRLATC